MNTMTNPRREFLTGFASVMTGLATSVQAREAESPKLAEELAASIPAADINTRTLGRISFGLAPGDLEKAKSMGLSKYLDQQLNYERINDSTTTQEVARLFPSLAQTPDQLLSQDPNALTRDLQTAVLYRAWRSQRQLYEVMVDFWSNHFNIFMGGNPAAALKIVDDREVIRPYAMGRFRDLLRASAKSPAMLFYLDNYSNTKYGGNENYARELLELHSLGVDGGYTQQDVVEVARCFTGWSINPNGTSRGRFQFYPQLHDTGAKRVLGVTIPAGRGIEDGEQVLDILASQASTANFISRKLCRRFIADDPPASVVAVAAAAFRANGGDIRGVLGTILKSPEFAAALDTKVKRPLEFICAAMRTLIVSYTAQAADPLRFALYSMGQLPFFWRAPDGYPDLAQAWVNSNNLLLRWNLATAFGYNKMPGLGSTLLSKLPSGLTPTALVDQLANQLLHRPLDAGDRTALINYAAQGLSPSKPMPSSLQKAMAPELASLMLASPYFQWR